MSQLHTQLPPYAFKQRPRSGHVMPQTLPRQFSSSVAKQTASRPAPVRGGEDGAAVLGYN